MKFFHLTPVFVSWLLLSGFSSRPPTPAPVPSPTPSPTPSPVKSHGSYAEKVPGFYLNHFDAVSDVPGCRSLHGLFRGGEPSLADEAWVKKLRQEGITHVLDLRAEGGDLERRAAEKARFSYSRVPLRTEGAKQRAGTAKQVEVAIQETAERLARGERVYVHCQLGEDRTGYFISLLRGCGDQGFRDFKAYGGSHYPALKSLREELQKTVD
jgi:hypothetical protein